MTKVEMKTFPLNYQISDHEREILNYFGEKNVINRKKQRKYDEITNVFICFTNRCGSNFLTEVIQSTDFFPSSGEFFNWDAVIDNSKLYNLQSFDEFCLFLRQQRPKNNFLISKIGYQQLFMLSKYGQIPNVINNPKFIWIKRRDVISQAVSLVIAAQTQKWTSYHEPTEKITPVYNMDSIARSVFNIVKGNTMFETYFKMFNADYLEIIYEDFCERTLENMKEICNFLNQDFKIPNSNKIRTKMQRNSLNEEFKARYLADIKNYFPLKL